MSEAATAGSTVISGGLGITDTQNAVSIYNGGSLTVAGGASVCKDLMVGGVIVSASDIRFKDNIKDMTTSDLELFKSIRCVRYKYKDEFGLSDDSKREHFGFIAQNLAELYPELVREASNGYYSVDYQKMTVILTKKVQHMEAKLNKFEQILETISKKQEAVLAA